MLERWDIKEITKVVITCNLCSNMLVAQKSFSFICQLAIVSFTCVAHTHHQVCCMHIYAYDILCCIHSQNDHSTHTVTPTSIYWVVRQVGCSGGVRSLLGNECQIPPWIRSRILRCSVRGGGLLLCILSKVSSQWEWSSTFWVDI